MSLPSRCPHPGSSSSSLPEWRVPLSEPCFGEDEVRAAVRVLESGWWTCGPETERLEAEFSEFIGVPHAIAVASGTAALELAHRALGLGPDDEVVTPSLSFVAAANSIVHCGAVPQFADVASLSNPLVSVETLERAITPRTRGITVMHYGGYACAMDGILELARSRGLWVIEDAAHAPGAGWKGRRCGAWGDVGCFSFFGNKNLTCGEGGMVVTGDGGLADKIRLLRSHGMTSLTWDRYRGHQSGYDVTAAGFNARPDDLRAGLLRVQLGSLQRNNDRRRRLVSLYRRHLDGDGRWLLPFGEEAVEAAHHLFVVALESGISRERVMTDMKSRGIQTSVHYPPIHQFSFYRKISRSASDLKTTEALGRRLLTLPLFPGMREEQVRWVCDALRDAAEAAER